MTPRRILMTADTVGGVWTYALELARALGGSGVEVALASMGARPDRAQQAEVSRVPNLRLFESAWKLEWMEEPWADVERAGEWLLRLRAEVEPDLVHLNNFCHAALPWRAPVLVVGHSCVLSWWKAVKREPVPGVWDRYRREVARGLAAADLVVAPTRAMLAALREHYGVVVRRGRVIPNGRDPGRFVPGPKAPFVLAAGRLWDGGKNLGMLERVAPRLRWPVYLAGEPQRPGGPRQEFAHVRLLGRLGEEDLARWLARASVYVLPARYEPFGLSVLEAALAGCALVLGDIPSLRENWDGVALFVPPDDEVALVDALNRLAGDASLLRSLRQKAPQRASAFGPDRMARGYLAAYRQLSSATETVCA